MTDDAEIRAMRRQQIDEYLEQRKQFTLGFVRFVLERGLQTKAPRVQGRPEETWRETGRRLYGEEFFEATLLAEVEARRKAIAERRKA